MISKKFIAFREIEHIYVNLVKITIFWLNGCPFSPGVKPLVKRKAWGGFWRSLYREVTVFTENTHFYEIHRFPHISVEMVGNRELPPISALSGWKGHPETSPKPYIYQANSPPGGEGPALSPKGGHFNGIHLNMAKFGPFS